MMSACGRAHRHVARSVQGQHPDPQLPQALRRPAEAPTHGCDGEGRALTTRNRPAARQQRYHQRHPPHAIAPPPLLRRSCTIPQSAAAAAPVTTQESSD